MTPRLSTSLLSLLLTSTAACVLDDDFEPGHMQQAATDDLLSICLLPVCDQDGDGFAYEGCYDKHCTTNPNDVGVKWERGVVNNKTVWCDSEWATFSTSENCPPNTIQHRQTESLECDHVAVDHDSSPKSITNLSEIKNHVRQQLIDQDDLLYVQPYGRNPEFAPGWQALLHDIHPGQPEDYDNQIDDDCDGLVDETEFLYTQYGQNVRKRGLTVWVGINDLFIKEHADLIVARVYPLSNVVDEDHLGRLEHGEGDSYLPQLPGNEARWIDEVEFDYSGTGFVSLDFDNLPNRGAVYAVELTFHKRIMPGLYFRLRYVDENGEPDFSPTPVHDSDGNRVTSEVFLTATQAYGKKGADPYSVMRRKITNSAIKELNLSLQGDVGWQDNYGFAGTSGEKYSGEYDQWWCGDFLASVYTRVNAGMIGTALHADDLFGWWEANWETSFEHATYARVGQRIGRLAEPGDYLLVGDNYGVKRDHATMFIAFSPSPTDPTTGNVWRIGGNESNRVKLQAKPLTSDYRGIGYLPHPNDL